MTMKPFAGATRREFLSGGLSITMLAASAPRDAAEIPSSRSSPALRSTHSRRLRAGCWRRTMSRPGRAS